MLNPSKSHLSDDNDVTSFAYHKNLNIILFQVLPVLYEFELILSTSEP